MIVSLLGRHPQAEIAAQRMHDFEVTSVWAYLGMDHPKGVMRHICDPRLSFWQSACGKSDVYSKADDTGNQNFEAFVGRVAKWLQARRRPHRARLGIVLDHLSDRERQHPVLRELVARARHVQTYVVSVQPLYLDWQPDFRANVDEWLLERDTLRRDAERFCRDNACAMPDQRWAASQWDTNSNVWAEYRVRKGDGYHKFTADPIARTTPRRVGEDATVEVQSPKEGLDQYGTEPSRCTERPPPKSCVGPGPRTDCE